MELHLDRRLAEKRIFPSIDILHSGTRREELLFSEDMLKQVYLLRRIVSMLGEDSPNTTDATERLMDRLARTANNAEFLTNLAKEK
jgi:transcription termination factor Rho